MKIDRDSCPPINETIKDFILDHKFDQAARAYRMAFGTGIKEARFVVEYERDRLLKDVSLPKEVSDAVARNVQHAIAEVSDNLARHLCVTRAHVLDHIVREAAKALEAKVKGG
jgi:hypothetical protein